MLNRTKINYLQDYAKIFLEAVKPIGACFPYKQIDSYFTRKEILH